MHRKKTITAAEFEEVIQRALAISTEPIQGIEFDLADLEYDFSDVRNMPLPTSRVPRPPALAPTGTTTGTLKVSIRIPAPTLAAFKARAAKTGTAYQSLINKTLSAAALNWGST